MRDIRTIGIVGTGVIGASWAAYFLAKGFDVPATDPAADAEANLHKVIAGHWPILSELGVLRASRRNGTPLTPTWRRHVQAATSCRKTVPNVPTSRRPCFAGSTPSRLPTWSLRRARPDCR